jgi:predicted DNA-binding ribbon-helix-helix protein
MDGAEIKKRSVMIAGHATSVSLEGVFWQALGDIATKDGKSVNVLVSEVDKSRSGNLSSALRVLVINRLQEKAG